MLKYLPVIAASLLLLSSIHSLASEELGGSRTVILSINGTNFEDLNMNAVFDDERGLCGWTIRLKLNGREIANTTTDESGRYSFINLEPGNYTITEDQQEGWKQSVPDGGDYDIYLDDKSAYRIDFGNFRVSRAPAKPSRASLKACRSPEEWDPDLRWEHPVMRVTPQMVKELQEEYKTAPKAYIKPEGM